MSRLRLAACAEMIFVDQPVHERARRLHDLGFEVEIWSWQGKDLHALRSSRATFSSMTGYISGRSGQRSDAAANLRAGAGGGGAA